MIRDNPNSKKMESATGERLIQLPESMLHCSICLDMAMDAVETDCCHQIFCETCLSQVDKCPSCRKSNFVSRANVFARRVIGVLPARCPFCENVVQKDNLEEHIRVCDRRPFYCGAPECHFAAEKEAFLTHLISTHQEVFLRTYKKIFPGLSGETDGYLVINVLSLF